MTTTRHPGETDSDFLSRAAADLQEPDDNNALRIIADHQLMSDEPPRIWADIVFGYAKDHGLILDYEVLATADGPYGLTFLVFTVTVALEAPFDRTMDREAAGKAAKEFLAHHIGEPPEIRFVEGVQFDKKETQ
jgi:hypothetical protein